MLLKKNGANIKMCLNEGAKALETGVASLGESSGWGTERS